MNEDDYTQFLTRLVEDPGHRLETIREAVLNGADEKDLTTLVETADSFWLLAHGAPPLDEDPVAAMLGLIVDPQIVLDSKALTHQRKRAGFTVSKLAIHLTERGWNVQTSDVFRWESRSATDVPPALTQAIAAVLHTTPELISTAQSRDDQFSAVQKTAHFQELVERWMKALGLPRSVALAAMKSRMVATVHRGEEPNPEQLLAALDTLVSAVEESRRTETL
ncbi:hypothetical protein [Arthrobacter sp. AET 35A]|uniref:hypothetical protein n=1 Tax=Arthrobacter sp. AET 35A TaxID=2292643 RepID=UPI001785F668|nr:hypothetical protein [Arthrobacter sp. AET 35A]MBE0011741.1 hypothetical protein [Arthrobacter sp. AET 35A]